ncbi:uncharacterized protein LOC134831993 [Culicoides brevitarsis]|uniref:uncharacterized protein LOC134831993 n=1 Tax=Culicoides brevitarsis TaxID=469753 RepID=UPI00307BDEE0
MTTIPDWDDDSDHLTISKIICKIGNNVRDKQKKNEDATAEIEKLKKMFLKKNAFASLVVCKTFVKLCESASIDNKQVMAIFLPMLQNSSYEQFTSIVECIFDVSLLALRKSCGTTSRYVCEYRIVAPEQHPLMALFSKETLNASERRYFLLQQIDQALNHHEKLIFEKSTEYLKPVLLYVFSNLVYSDALWKSLLLKSRGGEIFYQDVILYSRSDCSANALYTNNLICKATKYFLKVRDTSELQSLSLCLIVSTTNVAERGISVTNPLQLVFHLLCEHLSGCNVTGSFTNVAIMLLADLLQVASPYDTLILTKILKNLIVERGFGTSFALNMVLDGLTQKLSCSTTTSECVSNIEDIFNYVSTRDNNKRFYEECGQTKNLSSYGFFDERIAAYTEFDDFLRRTSDANMTDVMKQLKNFSQNYPLIARGLFLSNQLRYDAWLEVHKQLVEMNKKSKKMQNSWRMPFLFKIANEMHPKTKNLLLKSLPDFGKDAVINTITCIAKTTGKAYAISLYLKLWLIDGKTFSILSEALKENSQKRTAIEAYETQIAKAYVIKQICELKPTQHGADLIQPISELLNTPDNEVTIVLAIESLAVLCENLVVDIVSTWNEISFKFRYENRVRVLKSLFIFFSKIPKLQKNSKEFIDFTREIIKKLWSKALYHIDNDISVCGAAIDCLALFPKNLLFVDDIPALLKKGLKLEKEPDGMNSGPPELISLEDEALPEVWINLMENTYRQCIENVACLVSNLISEEVKEFRGGVYIVPEGRSEPKDFKNLPEKSVLRAIIQFLLQQSKQQTADDHIINGLLKALAFKYPKPLPPLDWNFLHEFFHNGIDLKHNCIRILSNQMSSSKTAKQMMENYIRNFDISNFQEEDIGVLYEMLPELTESADEAIYGIFVKKSITFSQSSDCSNILFEHILTSIPAVFKNKTLESKKNFINLCETLEETIIQLETHDEIFMKFVKLTKTLPFKSLNKIIMNGIQSKKTICYKKSLTLIKAACTNASRDADNPLKWLMQAIDETQKKPNQQLMTLETVIDIFSVHQSAKSCTFITELLTNIQNSLKKDSSELMKMQAKNKQDINLESVVVLDNCYLIEVFITCVIALSGNGFMFKNSMDNESNRSIKSSRCFPHSLCTLLTQDSWKEQQGTVLETLFTCYQHKNVPDLYADMFKNGIICCKNLTYFNQPQIWHRFIMAHR